MPQPNPLQLLALSLTVAPSAYLGPIFISNFITPHLQQLDLRWLPSFLFRRPATINSTTDTYSPRTSWSAPLPSGSFVVSCILSRAQSFLGTLLSPGRDEMGPAQIVRYTDSQKFDLHHDWFARPRVTDEDIASGRKRLYNRIAIFFMVLQNENVTEGTGETWFPYAKPIASQERLGNDEKDQRVWREHEEGGVAFKPIPGNAVFWVNLHANGSGDGRTLHAGLPVKGGIKTAMNVWPRVFFGPDA
ncbi:hypothetical protein QBC35DRAFT_555752 [Podospora australis]|uniref:Prolyl 4-hydroxylase alpha subunit domain-containing protein n=1 Tax=Podospora australis TaxID=1536484 RepID=A0AAN7AHE4_9PEZI|nr:hypothetical protein QBC35DRAFT_555752 [Podospora australis]